MSCKKSDNNNITPSATNTTQTLTDQEKESLLHMREEEKLARDVYTYMLNKWGLSIYGNISSSEQRHMDAVLSLLNTYGITDPVGNNPEGVFKNTELQNLYNTLITKGNISLMDALIVGATIEDMDLYDIRVAKEKISNVDIISVYDNLAKGSRNHMREFYSQLTSRGGSYTPQYITQTEFNDIINSAKEMGR
ncbi:MAG: DUF2202 domain-containing protein [Bacteroidetes bacterium]|nr:DUF2202 domain-containing protein [Bacteroidota bacterium]